jgi:hypothetical protein
MSPRFAERKIIIYGKKFPYGRTIKKNKQNRKL